MIKIKIFTIVCILLLISLSANWLQVKHNSNTKSTVVELKTQCTFLIEANESLHKSISKLSHENSVLVLTLDSMKSVITLKALDNKARKIKIHF